MGFESATITMPYEAFRTLQQAQADLVALQAQVQEQSLNAARSGDAGAYIDALLAACQIVGFAVGNLPPESTKNWPADALRAYASIVRSIPGVSRTVVEQMNDLVHFADEAERIDAFRVHRATTATQER